MVKRSRSPSSSPTEVGFSSPPTGGSCEEIDDVRPDKITALDTHSDASLMSIMQCSLPPHANALSFVSIDDFEVHYAKEHSNRCSDCGKNFPTARFLLLHIDENHNPLREALQAKGEKTYSCFLEDCDKKCSTPQKRRLHLIDKHMFPKIYNFKVVATGIDKSNSMLQEGRRRRVSTTNDAQHSRAARPRRTSNNKVTVAEESILDQKEESSGESEVEKARSKSCVLLNDRKSKAEPHLDGVDELERAMSALKFVPPSVLNKQRKKSNNAAAAR